LGRAPPGFSQNLAGASATSTSFFVRQDMPSTAIEVAYDGYSKCHTLIDFSFDAGTETKRCDRQFHRLKKWPDVRHGPGNNYIVARERDNFGRGLSPMM